MKKLHLLVLRSYIGPLILTFCIAIFVLLMQFLWKYIDDLVGKGLDLWIVVQLLFYASATFVPMALPLAILLASLMTMGNLGEHYELVAAKSSGISFRKIMMPLVFLSLIISGIAFYFSNQVLPVANLKMFSLLYDVKEQKPALNIKEGVFYREIDGYVIKVGEKDKDGQTIRRVIVYDHTKPGGNIAVTIAESGKMEVTEDKRTLIFTLNNGTNYNEARETRESLTRRPMQRIHFSEEQIRFDLSSFSMSRTSEDLFREHYQMMNLSQLFNSIDTLQEQRGIRQNMFAKQLETSTSNFYHLYIMKERPSVVGETSKATTYDEIRNDFSATQYRTAVSEAIGMARSNSMMVDNYTLEIDAKSKTLIKHWVEIHRKFTLSIACLLLFFIGAPLGAIIRKGGLGLPLVISVVVFIFYYIISITSEKFTKEGVLAPEVGMWISSAVLLPFGIWLTIKTTADSPLMESESWGKMRMKIKRFFTLKRKSK
jgi:lipopolysaccharide export system permease protein